MLNKITVIVFVCLFSMNSFADLTEKEKMILRVLTPGDLKAQIKKIYKGIQKVDTQMPSTHIAMFANSLKIYLDHPYSEADTGFSKKWLKSIYDSLMRMVKARSSQSLARTVRNAKSYRIYALEYAKEQNKLVNLFKHPKKVDKKRLKSLRRQAYRVRRELERKLKQ